MQTPLLPRNSILSNGLQKVKNDEKNKSTKLSEKSKILIIGDSHVRGLSSELRCKLGDNYEIMGIVKPNADTNQLKSTASEEVNKLTQKDIMIYCGGANDMSKNNAGSGLHQEIKYLRSIQFTNIVVITVPHRYDLNFNSCVNEEIRRFNRRLTEIVNSLNKVTLVNAKMDRELCTRHGLHYNKKGKIEMAAKISSVIQEIVEQKLRTTVIPLKWEMTLPGHTKLTIESGHANKVISRNGTLNTEEKNRNKGETNINMDYQGPTPTQEPYRCILRNRRPPARNEDFLWE